MIGLLQRVSLARVVIEEECIAEIGPGLLVLVGVEKQDTATQSERLLERILNYRVFPGADGRMNVSLQQIQGGLLLVPQFTLAADTDKGTRPSFTPAAPPKLGETLFEDLARRAASRWERTAKGRFGADMQVHLVNDGPVTFRLRARP